MSLSAIDPPSLSFDEVPKDMRWPIPVVCRDVDYFHCSGTPLMDPDDVQEFLQDELYGQELGELDVEPMLQTTYSSRRSVFDLADLIRDSIEVTLLHGAVEFRDRVPGG